MQAQAQHTYLIFFSTLLTAKRCLAGIKIVLYLPVISWEKIIFEKKFQNFSTFNNV